MSAKIFIDGQAGTTGLGIAQRLAGDAGHRADHAWARRSARMRRHRRDAMAQADLTVLCLPDEAAREAVALAPERPRILDASTAHRMAPGWVYGFPELGPAQAQNIAQGAAGVQSGLLCHRGDRAAEPADRGRPSAPRP